MDTLPEYWRRKYNWRHPEETAEYRDPPLGMAPLVVGILYGLTIGWFVGIATVAWWMNHG